jgi:hypothetical protein
MNGTIHKGFIVESTGEAWIPAPGLLPAGAGFAGMTMGEIGCESSPRSRRLRDRLQPGSRRYTLDTLSRRSNDETFNSRPYYYFFFGIGPPIGLQQLEKKAVGG